MEKKTRRFLGTSNFLEVNGVSLGLSPKEFIQELIEQGFDLIYEKDSPVVLKGEIDGLGICQLRMWGTADNIGLVIITTERTFSEPEVLTILEELKNDFVSDPLYDDGGYGVKPKPHEISHFWEPEQGYLKIDWDGHRHANDETNHPNGNILARISFWLRKPVIKDEAYWRSEVD